MNITPITDSTPACYGICCPKHGQCARYQAVEAPTTVSVIATCLDGAGDRPLFVEQISEEA